MLSLVLSLGLSVLAGELVLRLLLFGEHPKLVALGEPLRVPRRFASYNTPESWKLRTLFAKKPRAIRTSNRKHPQFHPLLGTRRKVFTEDFRHEDESARNGRRPVLLFGDSFGQCVQEVEMCWEDWLGESELGTSHYMLNYGVGGHGFDQIVLLMESVLPLYVDEDPIVILTLLADDDVDRCYLPMRTYPKPYFEVVDGELQLHRPPHMTPREYIRENPPEIGSYLFRYVLYSLPMFSDATRLEWTGHGDHIEEKQILATLLLERAIGLLEGAGVEHFVMLFHGSDGVAQAGAQWEDVLFGEFLEGRSVPWISSERYLRAAMEREGVEVDAYFIPDGSGAGHYNDRGNGVVFQGILDGLQGRF